MAVSVEGTVLETLPHGAVSGRRSSGSVRSSAHAPSGPGRNFIRVLVGDRVRLELSPRDLTRDGLSRSRAVQTPRSSVEVRGDELDEDEAEQ